MKQQTGVTEPLRDWFPLSASGAFSDVTDLMQGAGRRLGHAEVRLPSRTAASARRFMVSKKTKEWAPLSAFLDVERLLDGRADDRRRGARAAC